MLPSWKLAASKLYYEPGSPAAFSSAKKLTYHLKEIGYSVSQQKVQQWLNDQYTYQVHKQRKVTFNRNPIISQRIDYIWEADILFLFDLANYNNKYPCMLVCIDVVSRYAWVEPMFTKEGKSTSKAIERIFVRAGGRTPYKLHTDKGTEFYNKEFKSVMNKYNILLYSTESDKKAAIAERFIKELKKLIYRYLDSNQTNRYIDVLQQLVDSYNNTLHSSIGMKPSAVSVANEGAVLNKLYGHLWKKNTLFASDVHFKRGDVVRISLSRHPFHKGYKKVWSDELFIIHEVKLYFPFPMYKIREMDKDGDVIQGLFYDTELQHAPLKARQYHTVLKIFKTKIVKNKKWGLVNWTDAPTVKRWIRL